ncbi:hypothetical protein [Cellulomonas citrea]|uniref:hypothetical protein n=1 Tax=Cellulomonas citrea TaxID=1909423 RepID=UPI001357B113|nr:hypothetical protein [Cellulomonas citrea]
MRTKLGVDGVVDHCSDFYVWGGYGGQIANVGLMFTGVGEVGRATAGADPRGSERVVTGGSGGAWYSPDRYGTLRSWPW